MTKIKVLQNRAGVCSAMIGFNVGAINEPKRVSGISHILEHLLFNKSKRDYLMELQQDGFSFNAVTTRDITYFYIHGPADEYKRIVDALLSIVSSLSVDQKGLDREKRIVVEEFFTSNRSVAMNAMIPLLNYTNPYSNSVIGSMASIDAITLKDIVTYYEQYYVSPSCVMHIDQAYKSSAFNYFQKKVLTRFPMDAQKMAVVNMTENFSLKKECIEPYIVKSSKHFVQQTLVIGFATVPYNDLRKVVLELFAYILTHMITKQLRQQHGLIYGTICKNFFYKYVGVTAIQVGSAQGDMRKMIPMVFKLLQQVVRLNKVSQFEKLKKGFLIQSVHQLKTPDVEARHHLHDLLYDHHTSYSPATLKQFLDSMPLDVFKSYISSLINFDKSSVILYTNGNEIIFKQILKKTLQQYAV